MLFVGEALVGFGGAMYFTFISKNWFWYVLVGYVWQIYGTVTSFAIPETPQWLLQAGRKEAFAGVIRRIAKVNR